MPDESFTEFQRPVKYNFRLEAAIVATLILCVVLVSWFVYKIPSRDCADTNPPTDKRVDVKIDRVTDDFGVFHGSVHNGSDKSISSLVLEIETKEWKREYEVKTVATPKTTAIFRIETGARADLVSYSVISAK